MRNADVVSTTSCVLEPPLILLDFADLDLSVQLRQVLKHLLRPTCLCYICRTHSILQAHSSSVRVPAAAAFIGMC